MVSLVCLRLHLCDFCMVVYHGFGEGVYDSFWVFLRFSLGALMICL